MVNLKTIITQLSQTLLTGLLIAVLTLFGLPTASASAMQNSPMQLGDASSIISSESYHLKEIEDCIPKELTRKNKDIGERVARALSEMGNDQIERALNITDDPELSDAEIEFERCLETKGVVPQRQIKTYQ
ncbi:MAG: hypothetical protein ACOC0N_12770 [Chroococcales cyanobacterium]